jgi:hypothetical protein
MIRLSPWEVAGVSVRPLTVRERIALSEELADQKARKAADDALAVGFTKQEAIRQVMAAREEARAASVLVVECFTPAGAMRVLTVSCGVDGADALSRALSLDELSMTAVATLGIDIDAHRERIDQGKA